MRILKRHRKLSIALLVFVLLATAVAYVKLPGTYQAESNVVFIPSKNAGVSFGAGNPYLAFSGSLNELGDVIRYQVTDQREAQKLKAEGYASSYTVADAVSTHAPVLLVTVTGKSTTDVEHTLTAVTQAIGKKLVAMQSGIVPDRRVQEQVVSYATQPTLLTSKKLKPVIMILAIGLVLMFAVLLIIESVQAGRKDGKRGYSEQDPRYSSTTLPTAQEGLPQAEVRSSWADNDFARFQNGGSGVQRSEYAARVDENPDGPIGRRRY